MEGGTARRPGGRGWPPQRVCGGSLRQDVGPLSPSRAMEGSNRREAVGPIERDASIVASQAASADPADLAGGAQLVEHLRA